jgi:hypothetical protein
MESEVLNMDNGIFLTVNILIVLTTLIFLKLVGVYYNVSMYGAMDQVAI